MATSSEMLENHFTMFGEVEDAVVMTERDSERGKKSRGFGFVTFRSAAAMKTCLEKPHSIDKKEVGLHSDLRLCPWKEC